MFPLMLSWVSTIHCSQDFTVDVLHTYIDNSVFADGQTNMALSRVQNLENLHIKESNYLAFKTSFTVTEIMNFVAEKNLLKTIPTEPKIIKCSKTKVSTLKHTDQCSQANSVYQFIFQNKKMIFIFIASKKRISKK